MTATVSPVDLLFRSAVERWTADTAVFDAWDPAKHPRDRRGRFTKSRTVELTPEEKQRGNDIITAFKPKTFATDAAAMEYLNSGPDLPDEQASAVDSYTGDAFLDINRKLRSGKAADSDETVRNLRAAMRPLPDDLILTRTVGQEAFGSVPIEELAGKKVKDAAFMSTALGFAYGGTLGQVVLKIAVPKGTSVVFAAPYSRNPHEREIILGDGLEMAVASVKPNDSFGYTMTLIVLPKAGVENRRVERIRNADEAEETPPEVDLSATEAAFGAALALLLTQWASVVADWITQLVSQIASIFRGGDRAELPGMTVTTATATGLVQDAMLRLGETAARHAADEGAEQDVDLTPSWPARDDHADTATVTVDLLAQVMAASAAREAQRVAGPEPDADTVAEQVRTHLESLTDAEPTRALGGALHSAVHAARVATLTSGPVGSLYATEVMDASTCGPCRDIDGRFICNTDDLGPLWKLYPLAGYVDCKGRDRCRGTVTGAWRPQTTGSGA